MQGNQKTANSVAVVEYKVPRNKLMDEVPSSLRNVLFTYRDYLEVLVKVLFEFSAPIKYSRKRKRYHSLDESQFIISFIIDDFDKAPIAELELEFGEKPGSIQKVLEKARNSKKGEAAKDRISVIWVEEGNVKAEEQIQTGLTFFELAESSHAILNEVVAAYTRLLLKMKDERNADEKLIDTINTNKSLALKILHDPDNFSTIRQMQEIIDRYSPIVREFHRQSA